MAHGFRNLKMLQYMRYILLALMFLSAHVAHAQLFGRVGSSEKPAFHPQGLPATTVAPAIISRDDKPSLATGFESTCPEPRLDLSSVAPPAPIVNNSSPALALFRRVGVTVMSGFGYGLGQGYGFGSTSRIGYTFPFGLYLGLTGLFSLGTDFSSGMPMFGLANSAWLSNNTLGTELGFEVPVNLFGGKFANRVYAGVGYLWSSLTFSGVNTFNALNPAVAPIGMNGVFYTAGNLFYYRIPEFFILRNLLVGIDARYVFFGERSAFLAVPTLGVYF
jgi:hypothetical protein